MTDRIAILLSFSLMLTAEVLAQPAADMNALRLCKQALAAARAYLDNDKKLIGVANVDQVKLMQIIVDQQDLVAKLQSQCGP
jgi:cell division ATPase FtsA